MTYQCGGVVSLFGSPRGLSLLVGLVLFGASAVAREAEEPGKSCWDKDHPDDQDSLPKCKRSKPRKARNGRGARSDADKAKDAIERERVEKEEAKAEAERQRLLAEKLALDLARKEKEDEDRRKAKDEDEKRKAAQAPSPECQPGMKGDCWHRISNMESCYIRIGRGGFYESDITWTGTCVNQMASGKGVMTLKRTGRVTRIDGTIEDGVISGEGKVDGPDGFRYSGGIKDWEFDGYGAAAKRDGSTYKGGWRGGRPHGSGTYVGAGGKVITGVFQDGCFHHGDDCLYIGAGDEFDRGDSARCYEHCRR